MPQVGAFQLVDREGEAYVSRLGYLTGQSQFNFEELTRVISLEINNPYSWTVTTSDGQSLSAAAFSSLVNNSKLTEERVMEYFQQN